MGAYDLVVGDWDITIKQTIKSQRQQQQQQQQRTSSSSLVNKDHFGPALFPKITSSVVTNKENEDGDVTTTKSPPPRQLKNLWEDKIVPCHLSIHSDGTFTLSPKLLQNQSPSKEQQQEEEEYLPLKGEWYLNPNPYCVTDR